MRKQVTFAETQTIHRLHRDKVLPRRPGMNESNMDFSGPSAARAEMQLQQEIPIRIPKAMTAAPFLQHAALTPAQKEFLYTIAASHSADHVRHLITQHYMNVLHRCIRAGHDSDTDDLVVNTPENKRGKHQSTSTKKHQGKTNAAARHPGKSFLPKIPNRRVRASSMSASKQTKMKKRTTSPAVRRSSPTRAGVRPTEEKKEEEEEEEEGPDNFLSFSFSSLSLSEWDDDAFSDL